METSWIYISTQNHKSSTVPCVGGSLYRMCNIFTALLKIHAFIQFHVYAREKKMFFAFMNFLPQPVQPFFMSMFRYSMLDQIRKYSWSITIWIYRWRISSLIFLDLGQLNPALQIVVAPFSTLVVCLFIKIKENKKIKRNYVIGEQEVENEEGKENK